jgi:hypothetical protein
MPLSFMNPALLFGAAAAALPVIIHFLSRRKVNRRPFSDLRFLDEVRSRQARSLGLRRWLLLLLRVLAILLVALAASGPRWGGVGAGSGTRSVLFVIDTSASMDTQTDQGTRLGDGLAACADMIGALPEEAAVQILTVGSRVTTLFGDWLPAGAGAVAGLEVVAITDGAFDLAAGLREAARLVARAPGSPVEVILISDLQDAGPDAAAGEALQEAVGRLTDAGATRFLVLKVGPAAEGGGIVGIDLPSRVLRPGESITVAARVTAQYPEQVFSLELDGRAVAEAVSSKRPGELEVVEFPLTVPATGLHLGSIRKESDPFPGDDSRPFVLAVPTGVDVLIVHGRDRPVDSRAGRGGWRYFSEALAPGGETGAFRVRSLDVADLTTGAIDASDVVVFIDPDPLGRRLTEALTVWLAEGGAALFLVGEPTAAGYLDASLLPALGLPVGAEFQSVTAPGQRPRVIDAAHPIFQGLEREAVGTFEDIMWRRWIRLAEGDARALLVLTGEDPLLIEGSLGEGRFAVLPFDLEPAASDLAASPMALPFFQRLVAWLAGAGESSGALNTTVGSEARVRPRLAAPGAGLDRMENLQVIDTGGLVTGTPALGWRAGRPQLSAGVVDRAGFIAFLSDGDTLGIVAAGIPAAESALELLDVPAWQAFMAALGLATAGDLTGADPEQIMIALGGRNLAPWFLLAAMLLLAVELGVGRGVAARA